ncbi:MAG: serine/threonine-protein phosphatase [Halomonadaceae bacterium]|nr:MAG: serine/threonine-protein phosphatase [Halomonadaceae bacterium]
MRFSSTRFTHRGGHREHNEDAYYENRQSGLWLVADGMGGYRAGDRASQLVCETVADHLSSAGGELSVDALEQCLQEANRRIWRYGQEHLGGQTLGSTVVALQIQQQRYHVLWAGDSRCYRIRDGVIKRLSTDHSQVAEMVTQGLLTESDAEHHPLAHVITRAMGVDETLTLDHVSGDVLPGDLFMLCSDGVTREFSDGFLGQLLEPGHIEEASRAILHSALVNNCKDNITCIIVRAENGWYFSDPLSTDEDVTIPRLSR